MSTAEVEVLPAEFEMTLEERIQHSLATPTSVAAMPLKTVDRISKSRIHNALAMLANNNIENVQRWLEDVAQNHPALAVELYLKILEFSIPKLKAIAVANFGDKPLRDMSLAELQEVANEAQK